MTPARISVLTICGIDELPEHGPRAVTHVLSLLDPSWPELTGFQGYGTHRGRRCGFTTSSIRARA